MCWGKGECPKSKCNDELLHTNGRKVLSRKSSKYELRGSIRRGDVSLTIFNTNEGDSGVYCCRVEVPGWFNDVKKNIHLQLSRGVCTKWVVFVGGQIQQLTRNGFSGWCGCRCLHVSGQIKSKTRHYGWSSQVWSKCLWQLRRPQKLMSGESRGRQSVNCRVNMQRASASCLGDCHFTEICVHVLRSPGFYVHSIKICMLAKVKK